MFYSHFIRISGKRGSLDFRKVEYRKQLKIQVKNTTKMTVKLFYYHIIRIIVKLTSVL